MHAAYLINAIADIIERHKGNAVINATGGYKAEIAYATLVGLLYKKDVYYIHEEFSDVIKLPFLSVAFDFHQYESYLDQLRAALEAHSLEEAEASLCNVPEEIRTLFIMDKRTGRCTLSPMGLALVRAFEFQRQSERRASALIPNM
jgi:CRISPR/Cas system-associated protein Csm6